MKTILAIETSTARGSIALVRGDEILFDATFAAERSHNSLLFGPLAEALAAGDPQFVVAGTGPGSYTGVRVGLAAAMGIALAKNIPWCGWPSLTAIDSPPACQVAGDARRGLFFLATLENHRLSAPPDLMTLDELKSRVSAPTFTFDDAPLPLDAVQHAQPSAYWLARRAAQLSDPEIAALAGPEAPAPEPIYLRAPFITTAKRRSAGTRSAGTPAGEKP